MASILVEEEFVPFVNAQVSVLRSEFEIVESGVLRLRAPTEIAPQLTPLAAPWTPSISLTPKEQREFVEMGALSQTPVRVTGIIRKRRNVVDVGGLAVELRLSPFRLLLRLVAALYETTDGFIHRGGMLTGRGLVEEGYYNVASIDQALARLRDPFRSALGETRAEDFIEVSASRVRISTHARYVDVELDKVRQHPDARVRELAERVARAMAQPHQALESPARVKRPHAERAARGS